MSRKELLLIDGDILLHRFAHSNEYEVDWGDSTSKVMAEEEAKADLDEFVGEMKEKTDTTRVVMAVSGDRNFRYTILPTYKHNRKDAPRPELVHILRGHLYKTYDCKTRETLEADDVMGLLMTINPGRFICASIDKDLKQIPGLHWNWNAKEFRTISQEEADFAFYLQVLTGDPTDGYTGIPKVGPKKAEKILMEELAQPKPDMWKAIVQAYEKYGLTEQDALTQARVARILRKEDWDFKKGVMILWTPAKLIRKSQNPTSPNGKQRSRPSKNSTGSAESRSPSTSS
jgi:DNA polymerase-1